MRHLTTFAAAALVLVALVQAGTTVRAAVRAQLAAADKPPATSLDPDVVMVTAADAQASAVVQALARFRTAGLALPALEIRHHDDEAPCYGHKGYFDPSSTPWHVDVCSDLAFVVTHELAHAWIEAHLDQAARSAVVAATGAAAWNTTAVGWNDRAVEQAAFVMQQILMVDGRREVTGTWADRAELYVLITGQPVPWA